MIDITEIVVAVLGLLATVITTYLVPFLKKKMSAQSYDTLLLWTQVAVEAAEMLYTESGKGAEKKAYVTEYLQNHGITVDEETISVLIESAVCELKRGSEE